MAAPGQPRAPVATGGFLMLLSAFYSYNFIYSRFPPPARSGPSSPSRARLSSSSSGCFLGRKGIRDRYREEPFPMKAVSGQCTRTPLFVHCLLAEYRTTRTTEFVRTPRIKIYNFNRSGVAHHEGGQ